MAKNIILLSDGTGNAAGSPHKTNVWRLYQALQKTDSNKQIAFYDDGVGTSSFIVKRLLGQVFGWGLKRNVKDLYRNLCQTYNDNDKIYVFGYSRGAYTARILAALIANQGIIRKFESQLDLNEEIERAYDDFRHQTFVPSLLSFPWWVYRWFRKTTTPESRNELKRTVYSKGGRPLIDFLGVWDTVDAYGAPIDEVTRGWDMIVWPLTAKDRDLSPAVKVAYHALALDEQRKAFEPVLWNEHPKEVTQDEQPDPNVPVIEQVWFPGVHANVGGGYPDDSLAYVSLKWMMQKCNHHGLDFDAALKSQYENAANPDGPLYDNRSGLGNVYRFAPRKIETLCNAKKPGIVNRFLKLIGSKKAVANEVRVDNPKIHHTVFDRIRNGRDAYAPINLPEKYCIVDEVGKIVQLTDKPGKNYNFETITQSKQRRIIQSEAWNTVWFLKVLFAILMLAIFGFALGPYIFSDEIIKTVTNTGDVFVGSLSTIFMQLPIWFGKAIGLGFLDGWAEDYSKLPYIFVFFLILIGAIISLGVYIKSGLVSTMRQHWAHLHKKGNSYLSDTHKRSTLAEFLDSYRQIDDRIPVDENKIKISLADHGSNILKVGIEILSALAIFWIVLWIIWKILFTATDGLGGICEPAEDRNSEFGQAIIFDPSDPCFDTGLPELKNGYMYEIKFSVPPTWKDSSIKSDAKGWVQKPAFYVRMFAPYKRSIFEDWYVPIARVGDTKYDRHSGEKATLPENTKGLPDGWIRTKELDSRFTIKARQDGRMYFYLNDAVSPWPFAPWVFYDNNCKAICETGKITVTELGKADSGETEN